MAADIYGPVKQRDAENYEYKRTETQECAREAEDRKPDHVARLRDLGRAEERWEERFQKLEQQIIDLRMRMSEVGIF